MNVINNIGKLFSKFSKKSMENNYQPSHRPKYIMKNRSNTNNVYYDNVIIYRCIRLISDNIANIPCYLKDNDNANVTDHEVLKLLQKPNEHSTWSDLIGSVITDLLLYGNAYLHKNNDEIIRINSNKIEIINDATGNPVRYQCGSDTISINDRDFLHIKLPNPYTPWKGMSPTCAIMKSAKLYDSIIDHNQSVLDNGGRISGAIVFDQELTEEQKYSLQEQFNEHFIGSKQAGRVAILDKSATWKEMSISPKDMDFHDAKLNAAKEIAFAFGVPPIMIGIQDSSLSNYKEARLHFWEDTLLPFANMIRLKMQELLLHDYKNLKLEYDFSEIPAMSVKKQNYEKHIDSLSFLSSDEKRKLCEY